MTFYVDWDNIFTNSLFFNVVSTYSVINWIFLVLVRARIQNTSKCYIVFINKDVDKIWVILVIHKQNYYAYIYIYQQLLRNEKKND